MTITATPQPSFEPPRNEIQVSVPVGGAMSAVSVWRNDSFGRTLLRSQPSSGFDSRTVYDYEAPYGESVTYDWAASYAPSGGMTTVWSESWASLASWTGDTANFAVASSTAKRAVANPSDVPKTISRSVASGSYRVTIASLSAPATSYSYMKVGFTGVDFSIRVQSDGFNPVQLSYTTGGGAHTTTISPSAPVTLEFLGTSVTLKGTGGSYTIPLAATAITAVNVTSEWFASTAPTVGAITVASYPVELSIAEQSSAVTLNSTDAWMIHPGTPGLSFALSETDTNKPGIREVGSVVNRSKSSVHTILGSRSPVTTTTGPREDDVTSLEIATVTSDDRSALRALLESDVAILIQIPPAWDIDFNCGFYSVGDVSEDRLAQIGSMKLRSHILPLARVQSPVVTAANSGWSYAAVAVDFAAYSAVEVAYATYGDLAANNRS